VEPTTKVINATRTVLNFQKPAWNVREFYFGGSVRTRMHSVSFQRLTTQNWKTEANLAESGQGPAIFRRGDCKAECFG